MKKILYLREGCHLCDAFIAECKQHNPDWLKGLQQVDIDAQPVALARYSDRVPVIVIGDQVICSHFFDPVKLSPYFRE